MSDPLLRRVAGERGPVVYVVQQPRVKDRKTGELRDLNIAPALDFGAIEVLLEPGRQVMFNAATVVRELSRKLALYEDRDFIMAAGDPVGIGIACAIAASVNDGRFTVLKWDQQETRYFPVAVDLQAAERMNG